MTTSSPFVSCTGLLCLLVCALPLFGQDQGPTDWYLYDEPGVSGWKTHLEFDSRGHGWLGGVFPNPTRQGLWYFDGRHWRPRADFPVATKRTYVFSVDQQDHCWVVPFSPYLEKGDPREHFDLWHFDGESWVARPIVGSSVWPQAMAVFDANFGFILGNNRRILQFDKKGFTVTQAKPNRRTAELPLAELRKMNFLNLTMVDRNRGFASGSNGLVAAFRDGEWTLLDVPAGMENLLFHGQHIDPQGALWLASEGVIARYQNDQWTSWTDLPSRGSIRDIAMLEDGRGYAVGNNGIVMYFDGRAWRNTSLPGEVHGQVLEQDAEGHLWILGDGKLFKNTEAGPPKLREVELGQPHPLNLSKKDLHIVDINHDQRLDLVFSDTHTLLAYPNQGLGLYGNPTKLWQFPKKGTVTHTRPIHLFDGERPEWLVITNVPGVNPLLAHPGRTLKPLQRDIADAHTHGLPYIQKIMDLDNDGDLDLYLTYRPNTRVYHRLVENRHGRFVVLPADRIPESSGYLTWGDLDGDGDLDGIDMGYAGDTLVAFRNEGAFQFTPFGDTLGLKNAEGYGYGTNLVIDLDADGDNDILCVRDRIEAWANDGTGRFTRLVDTFPTITLRPDSNGQLVSLGDINHNGYPEISLSIPATDQHYLLTRTPQGRWLDVAGQMLIKPPDVFLGGVDLDLDGDLDLVGHHDGMLKIYENQSLNEQAIIVTVTGPPQNRDALGTQIRLFREQPNGARHLTATHRIESHDLFNGIHMLKRRHLLATPHTGPHSIEVIFSSGRRQTIDGVLPGDTLTVTALSAYVDPLYSLLYRLQLSPRFVTPWLEAVKLLLFLVWVSLTYRILVRRKTTPLSYPFRGLTMAALPLYGLIAFATTPASIPMQLAAVLLYGCFLTACALLECGLPAWYRAHFIGPYKILGIVGEGGMGVVYRARDVVRGRIVALKTFPAELTSDREVRKRFQREASILKSLQHPSIVPVYETGEFDGRGFIAMELLQGVTLKRIVAEQKQINWRTSLDIFTAAAGALDYIHRQGIQHRDLKAENIFITHETIFQSPAWRTNSREIAALVGGRLKPNQIKLMDFGLSRHRGTQTMTRGGGLIGTLAYLAPEQIIHRRSDLRSDIYSFGVLMYETVSGRLPYSGSHEISLIGNIRKGAVLELTEAAPEIPLPLAQIIMKALAFSPEQRFESAATLYEALADFQQQSYGGAFEQTLVNYPAPTAVTAQPPTPASPPSEQPPTWSTTVAAQTKQWRRHFERAKELRAADNLHEAHLAMCNCIDDLEKVTVNLPGESWETYAREFEVDQVMRFMEQLNTESGG